VVRTAFPIGWEFPTHFNPRQSRQPTDDVVDHFGNAD
jgi:hypothetical protein